MCAKMIIFGQNCKNIQFGFRDAGFQIRFDIDRIQPPRTNRIRIQPLRTNRIQIHDFFKTKSGSGSRHFCLENFKFSSNKWLALSAFLFSSGIRGLKPDPEKLENRIQVQAKTPDPIPCFSLHPLWSAWSLRALCATSDEVVIQMTRFKET